MDGSITPLGADFTIPAQVSPNPTAYVPNVPIPTLQATPWWQQWYVIVPALGAVAFVLFGMKKKSKASDASAMPSIIPTLSGILGRKRKRK